jgi:hypothetical protein
VLRKEENVEVAVQAVMELQLWWVRPCRRSSNIVPSFSTWQVLAIRVVLLDSAFQYMHEPFLSDRADEFSFQVPVISAVADAFQKLFDE